MMEDRVPDTPVRPGKKDQAPAADSDVDGEYSGEETVATVPLHAYQPPPAPTQPFTVPTQPLTERLTQPTQIIEKPTAPPAKPSSPRSSSPVVQVSSSSPPAPKTTNNTNNTNTSAPAFRFPASRGGLLSSAMAPAGTRFRAPPPIPSPAADSSKKYPTEDDGPTYRGGSSDEEDMQANGVTDIKPSTFTRTVRSPEKDRVAESPVGSRSGNNQFKEITAAAFYNPSDSSVEKRKADDSFSSSNNLKRQRSDDHSAANRPDNASYITKIPDFQSRDKVRRMLSVFPKVSAMTCYEVLLDKKGNYQDSLQQLAKIDEEQNHSSEDELSVDQNPLAKLPPPAAPTAKQQIKAHSRIQDRWTSSQKSFEPQKSFEAPPKPGRRLIRGQKSRPPSPPAETTPTTTAATAPDGPVKKPGRLIRGTKNRSPSGSESPVLQIIESDTSEAEEPESYDHHSLENRVLNFFNDCSVEDLADIAEISIDLANILISKRPFSSLDAIRKVSNEDPAAAKGRRGVKKAFGDKVVDKCLDMWTGYEAVDSLVSQCESLGKPVAEEMKRWGVDVFGSKTDGELECVALPSTSEQPHDSGIGTPSSNRSSSEEVASRSKSSSFVPQPAIFSETKTMKDYQIVGLNWLSLLFRQGLSGILADDMGLGKTCQVIAFLAHLLEQGVTGPHLVVVPSSTLENWLREFSIFCPKLEVMPYYADQATRAIIRENIEKNRDSINVVITTYTIAKAKHDSAFLRTMDFCACVYDEGHMLKSSKSLLYEKLIRIPARFRLLLTGTPLQNNLQELASLLGFILPSVFKEQKEDLESIFSAKAKTVDDTHSALLSAQRIARAKSMLTPFVLRRKKHQVIDLPPKIARVEYCTMTESQKDIYQHQIATVQQLIADRRAGKKGSNKSANILMKLRQAAIHPLFYRRLYDDKTLSRMSKACLKEPQWAQSDPDQIYSELYAYSDYECHDLCIKNPDSLGKFTIQGADEWLNSGKVAKLQELLKKFIDNGDRVLIFSQFTMVMDILEHALERLHIQFFRLDGTTSVEDRQSILDAFHDQVNIPVFMLSTKAGGAGINLACANKVIIFDSSFNPQEDIQAENRAHRVGQTREVEVVRLVTRDTIEEQIYALGQTKLALDQRVAGEEDAATGAGSKKREEAGLKVVEDMVIATLENGEPKEAAEQKLG